MARGGAKDIEVRVGFQRIRVAGFEAPRSGVKLSTLGSFMSTQAFLQFALLPDCSQPRHFGLDYSPTYFTLGGILTSVMEHSNDNRSQRTKEVVARRGNAEPPSAES